MFVEITITLKLNNCYRFHRAWSALKEKIPNTKLKLYLMFSTDNFLNLIYQKF